MTAVNLNMMQGMMKKDPDVFLVRDDRAPHVRYQHVPDRAEIWRQRRFQSYELIHRYKDMHRYLQLA